LGTRRLCSAGQSRHRLEGRPGATLTRPSGTSCRRECVAPRSATDCGDPEQARERFSGPFELVPDWSDRLDAAPYRIGELPGPKVSVRHEMGDSAELGGEWTYGAHDTVAALVMAARGFPFTVSGPRATSSNVGASVPPSLICPAW